MTRGRGGRPRRTEKGAAALEFGLVMVPLLVIVIGVLQYGLYFNDYLQARQGVRQGARTAVVQGVLPCGTASNYAAQIGCYTKSVTSPVTGSVAVRIVLPGANPSATPPTTGWEVGQPLLVCEVVKTANVSGLLPMPNDGYILAKTQMAIEQDTTAPTGTFPYSDADPSGANWSWCS